MGLISGSVVEWSEGVIMGADPVFVVFPPTSETHQVVPPHTSIISEINDVMYMYNYYTTRKISSENQLSSVCGGNIAYIYSIEADTLK